MGLLEYDLDPQQLALDVAAGSVDLAPRGGAPARARPARRRRGRGRAPGPGGDRADRRRPDRPPRDHRAARRRAATVDRHDPRRARPRGRPRRGRRARRRRRGRPAHRGPGRSRARRPAPGRRPGGPRVAARRSAVAAPSSRERRRAGPDRQPAGARRAPARSPTASPPSGAATSASRRRRRPSGRPRTRSSRPSSGSTSSRPTRWPRSSPTGVDPDRALSDHAFAHRLHRRAGHDPDDRRRLARRRPGPARRDPVRSGDARAAARSRSSCSPSRSPGATGCPTPSSRSARCRPGSIDEPAAGARAIAEVEVRRALYPDHPLAFVEPDAPPTRRPSWPHILAAVLVRAGDVALVIRRPGRTQRGRPRDARGRPGGRRGGRRRASRASSAGVALDHARGAIGVALATLDMLADRGWRAVVGRRPGRWPRRGRIGGDAVAERTEPFDPFESLLGRAAIGSTPDRLRSRRRRRGSGGRAGR